MSTEREKAITELVQNSFDLSCVLGMVQDIVDICLERLPGSQESGALFGACRLIHQAVEKANAMDKLANAIRFGEKQP
jgi:sugar (pentulose or hexulose) kinase